MRRIQSGSVILTLNKRLETASTPTRYDIRLYALLALFILCINLAFADPLALQSFENSTADTWSYTASPASTVPNFWGRTNQAMGGATAQSGTWYWASWLMENSEASMIFSNVALTPGTLHSISFYYYSKNLNHATDQLEICLEFDNGTEWNNWIPLLLDTQAWSLFSINIPQTASTVRVKILTQYSNPGMDKYVHWDNFSIKAQEAEFTAPVVFNTSVVQRADGSKLVDITYDLFDANGDNCEIGLMLSEDGGATFNIIPTPALVTGDIGAGIAPGFGKHIIWDAGAEGIDFDGSQYVLQFVADDPTRENFVFVEGGTVAGITVSDFYIDKYETTQAGYQAMMGTNPASGSGVGDNYPVYNVSWFNAIEYCNRRSIQEGFTPCYSYLSYGTNPADWPSGWNTNDANHVNVNCDFNAIGYRLPTEAEWEYAARGGLNTHGYTYSGSNDLNAVGWYSGNSGGSSHPVGQLAANELGTYDMSGNLWEWCWDRYSPTSPFRVRRGGSCGSYANYSTVSDRFSNYATSADSFIGFRICRVSP
ncbi:MAG: formylglycine-generating enzyme family protein [Candidatus Cloacimonetes bacterium]|jgi:formylglycine-generating enzyme required for sulfatase activity|nr:formylglycine-generating enzyme family protein [Candidatus Cloacimonadota bacterium]MDD3098023.1 formylglycine-generating enzyme family protein [Candidatus Cloacimonadota bacterium]MDD3578592.1 formylglycine-generating enzyme family protein [Candidatus Cloacimonadota bacterium]MDD4667854.1 formylglycine-generating enzyme family protein [Candidatus Cloacimonadota bacterium]